MPQPEQLITISGYSFAFRKSAKGVSVYVKQADSPAERSFLKILGGQKAAEAYALIWVEREKALVRKGKPSQLLQTRPARVVILDSFPAPKKKPALSLRESTWSTLAPKARLKLLIRLMPIASPNRLWDEANQPRFEMLTSDVHKVLSSNSTWWALPTTRTRISIEEE